MFLKQALRSLQQFSSRSSVSSIFARSRAQQAAEVLETQSLRSTTTLINGVSSQTTYSHNNSFWELHLSSSSSCWRGVSSSTSPGQALPERTEVEDDDTAAASSTSTSSTSSTPASPGRQRQQECLDYVLRQAVAASSQSGATPTQLFPPDSDAAVHLRNKCHDNDNCWALASCGEWKQPHPRGWSGPARALLQMWPNAEGSSVFKYRLWELAPDWVPTGCSFASGTGFESVTTNAGNKYYQRSCNIHQLDSSSTSSSADSSPAASTPLRTWLAQTFGQHAALLEDRGLISKTQGSSGLATRKSAPGTSPLIRMLRSGGALDWYTGGSVPVGANTAIALKAAASAAAGPPPVYAWPQELPPPKPVELSMGPFLLQQHNNLVDDILAGVVSLQHTHVPLELVIGNAHASSSSSSSSSSSQSAGGSALGTAAEAAAAAGVQVYDLQELQKHAELAAAGAGGADAAVAGAASASASVSAAVVPDATRPFKLTMFNPADGRDYVVAHYEPRALAWQREEKAALLCEMFHGRHRKNKMVRGSAPANEWMTMAGMRLPQSCSTNVLSGNNAQFGRYHGDDGPEADAFSLACWPYLATTGGFKAISQKWMDTLPALVNSESFLATEELAQREQQRQQHKRPANFPSPCLLGAPFTTLGITQNYHSKLHCEPDEHPFSYITWLDVLSGGSSMEVAYFWLTPGLAFTPLSGSALYIDVRLVTHCSDPCVVYYGKSALEGRYGAALFIKPSVVEGNTRAWARLDSYLGESSASTNNSATSAVDSSGEPAQ